MHSAFALTQMIWTATKYQLVKITVNELQHQLTPVPFCSAVADLGVAFDAELEKPCDQSTSIGLLSAAPATTIRSPMTPEAKKSLAHAFVSSRLANCNSLLYAVHQGFLKILQSVQSMPTAARVIPGARKFNHITPMLKSLPWLPILKDRL